MPVGEREEDYERRNNVRVGAKELAQQDVESKCQWERGKRIMRGGIMSA